MIDVLFGDSPAGALKAAKGVLGNRLGTICPLTLALDIGRLDEPVLDRISVLRRLFQHFPDADGVVTALAAANRRSLAHLRQCQGRREPVRIWVSRSDPAEWCGFLFVCHLLGASRVPLLAVFVPEPLHSTGEIVPEQFASLILLAQHVSCETIEAGAREWQTLVGENAPLRAVVNGRVLSVPENFYDFVLRRVMPDRAFHAAQLIGRALLALPGVGDGWLYLRMQVMVAAGELEQLAPAEPDHPYSGRYRAAVT
ncbi:MAG: DUF1835 domain-containing protein [Clostridiaceae bacterium]|jgi:hypothetical protein|nr:DUF1835 domain-containing protein [Clostridiaceae bacterium]